MEKDIFFKVSSSSLSVSRLCTSCAHREPTKGSPLDFVKQHKRVLTFCGFFEYHASSKNAENVHDTILIVSRVVFIYIGCILQFMALLQYSSTEEVSTIISVGAVYLNSAVKDVVFRIKRRNIEKLWHRFEDDDFRAKAADEFK